MTVETKLDQQITLVCYVIGFVAIFFTKVAPFTTLGVLLTMLGVLTWRIVLFYRRKRAECRRIIAYWERPRAQDVVHIVRDVMDS